MSNLPPPLIITPPSSTSPPAAAAEHLALHPSQQQPQQQQLGASAPGLQFTFSSPEQSRHPSIASPPPGSLPPDPLLLGQFHLSDEDTLVSDDTDDADQDHELSHQSAGSHVRGGIDLRQHLIVPNDLLMIQPSSASDNSPATIAASQPLEQAGDSDEEESNVAFQRLLGSPRPGGGPKTFVSSSPGQQAHLAAFSPNDAIDFALSPSSGGFPAQAGEQELWSLSSSPRSTPSSSVGTAAGSSLGRFNPFRGFGDSEANQQHQQQHYQLHHSNSHHSETSLHFDDSDSDDQHDQLGDQGRSPPSSAPASSSSREKESVYVFDGFSQQMSHPPGMSGGPRLSINDDGIHSPSSYRDAADEEFTINSDTDSGRPSPLRTRRSILSMGPRGSERRKKSVRWLDSETNQKLTQVYLLDYEYDRKPAAFLLPSRVAMPNPSLPDPISSTPTRIPMIIVAICILAIIAVVLILLLRHYGVI